MTEHYHKWYSNYLSREFSMLAFGHAGFPVIIFPTSGGRYYEAKDRGLIDSAKSLVEAGKIRIYCPDSINNLSWYNYSIHPADRVKTHIGYENLILNDLFNFINYETGYERMGVAGCSFGAYHAANIAFRHPDKISYLFCMGGAYDIKQFIMGYYDDNCYFNNPPDYLSNLNDEWYLGWIRKMGIILGTGEWDMCLAENIRLSGLLNAKNISHWLDLRLVAGHDWPWWKQMFPEYLSKIDN
ncbi:MAG: esterase family protein [Ignavibacteriaceae bacterium]|nr:esterase family protein [Ignavibacteriaceae bacterium]